MSEHSFERTFTQGDTRVKMIGYAKHRTDTEPLTRIAVLEAPITSEAMRLTAMIEEHFQKKTVLEWLIHPREWK